MNDDEKIQAATELGFFVGRALVDISKRAQYGFGPPRMTAKETKEAIDAINNLAKISPFNDDQIELLNKIMEFAKLVIDHIESQKRW